MARAADHIDTEVDGVCLCVCVCVHTRVMKKPNVDIALKIANK